jgi:fatty-acyl-CoA synthase
MAASAHTATGLVWAPDGAPRARWTFKDLLAAATRLAHVLAAQIPAVRPWGVQAPSSPMWLILQHAAALARIRLVAIPPALPSGATKAISGHTECVTVVDEQALVEALEVAPGPQPLPDVDPTSIAQVQLTSGTTTEPRGVLLAHAALMGQATALADALEIRGTDVVLNPNPMFHVSGQFISLAALSRGACLIVAPYEPEHLLNVMATERASMLGLPPALLAPLLDAWAAALRDVIALRLVALGGMIVPEALIVRGEQRWDARFCAGYGLTEAGASLMSSVRGIQSAHVAGPVGRGLRGVKTRIVDAADGRELEPGRAGRGARAPYLPGLLLVATVVAPIRRAMPEPGVLAPGSDDRLRIARVSAIHPTRSSPVDRSGS